MNQKYLKGIIEDTGDGFVFKATPENIASFIWRYSWDAKVTVATLDHRMFLTASLGMVSACPDTKYLNEHLMPALKRVMSKPTQEATLVMVPAAALKGERCPLPDWNFLYWAGYSDRKYQMILDKSGLLPFSDGRCNYLVEVAVHTYQNSNGLAVSLVPWRGLTPGEEIWLTVNPGEKMRLDHAYLNVEQYTPEVLNWLEANNIAQPTGRNQQLGFSICPEFSFNPVRLRELDPDGYERHLQCQAEQAKKKGLGISR